MAFVRLEDLTGNIEVVIFPKIYARTTHLWVRDSVVMVSGKADEKDDRVVILADDAKAVEQAMALHA
jgi:DNA polymerase-3 subunit alpha